MNRSLSLPVLLLAALLLAPASGAALGDGIRLRESAQCAGPAVTLRDVADLDGETALKLGDLVIGQLETGKNSLSISLAQVRQALDAQNVNWGKLTLAGFAQCVIGSLPVAAIQPAPQEVPATQPAVVLSNPLQPVESKGVLTVGEQLIAEIEKISEISRADLRITFANSDQAFLAKPVLDDRLEFEFRARGLPGRLPVMARRYRDGKVVESQYLRVDVERRYLAVVAVRPLGHQQVIGPADVEIREIYLSSTAGQPQTELTAVIGKQTAGAWREGEVITAERLRAQVLVERGKQVVVRCVAGNLVIRMSGLALEDGVEGQMITIRNGKSGENFSAQVSGRGEVVANSGSAEVEARADAGPAGRQP
ncbi:MAG: flagellar basal body P-ring formation protein FlgA [Phycisphaeraceae bacterium]|nr:flagellar basal body P-ring formation protein FlgA [Phycisphaeraceae bacterium]